MFHLLAFGQAALDASAGDVQVPAIADQQYSRANSNFQIPTPHKVLFAFATGIGLVRARLNTASLRLRGFPQVYGLNNVLLPPSNGNILDTTQFPINLKKEEDLRVDGTNGAANTISVLVGITPENPPLLNVNGTDLRVVRFTSTVTAAAIGWSTPAPITFQDTLEGGIYNIYGMGVQTALGIGARLILQGQALRPGCICQAAITDAPRPQFMGKLGLWGSFNTYSPPQIETFETTAAASNQVGWLLCSKVSDY